MNFTNVLIGGVGGTILSIVLFFVALGVLVTIHELGHFIAAKTFKVYCSDFSIGFGPKIIKIKRKKGETTYSVGLLPLGGYVSMLGEENNDIQLPDGVTVPDSRTLNGIKRWKRIAIMSAGIIMNFVLAYIIFFICASCFPQVAVNAYYDVDTTISQKYIVDEAGQFGRNDQISVLEYSLIKNENGSYELGPKNETNIIWYVTKDTVSITNKDGKNIGEYIVTLSPAITGINNTDISHNIFLYKTDETSIDSKTGLHLPLFIDGKPATYNFQEGDIISPIKFQYLNALTDEEVTTLNTKIDYERDESNEFKKYDATLKLAVAEGRFEDIGVSFHKISYWNGWGSFAEAGKLWTESTTVIAKALGGLFIGQGWDQLGGPLAIFSQTTQVLENYPFNFYLQTWGVISVNLALFNLLPFPGLDGWQIVVELVEGGVNLTKKTIHKAKTKKSKKDKNEIVPEPETTPIDLRDNEVTLNKDANLVIGKADDKSYKEWKIPAKVKGIMSYVGLGLIFALMIFVIIKDIMNFF